MNNLVEIHPWHIEFQGDVPLPNDTDNVIALQANPTRRYLLVQNKGQKSIFVRIKQATVAGGANCIEIAGGGKWEPAFVPRESVNIISAQGAGTAHVLAGK